MSRSWTIWLILDRTARFPEIEGIVPKGKPFAPETAPKVTAPAPAAETIPVAEAPVAATRKASFLARCSRAVRNAARQVAALPGKLIAGVKGLFRKTKGITRRLNIAWQLKKAAFFGVGIGVAVAFVSLASHPLVSILSGIGAAGGCWPFSAGQTGTPASSKAGSFRRG